MKQSNNSSQNNHSDFTIGLALADLIPCVLFCGSGFVIGRHFGSSLFLCGIMLCAAAGFMKVLWKILIVASRRDCQILNRQLRVLMPAGFLLIILSLILGRNRIGTQNILRAVLSFPQLAFFLAGIAGMCLMVFFAIHNDDSARSNWMEEITNSLAQLMFFIGLLII